jgi:hypothetical protein
VVRLQRRLGHFSWRRKWSQMVGWQNICSDRGDGSDSNVTKIPGTSRTLEGRRVGCRPLKSAAGCTRHLTPGYVVRIRGWLLWYSRLPKGQEYSVASRGWEAKWGSRLDSPVLASQGRSVPPRRLAAVGRTNRTSVTPRSGMREQAAIT